MRGKLATIMIVTLLMLAFYRPAHALSSNEEFLIKKVTLEDFKHTLDPYIVEGDTLEALILVKRSLDLNLDRETLVKELVRTSKLTQSPVIAYLSSLGIDVLNTFWLSNLILVRLSKDQLYYIANHPMVEAVYPNFKLKVEPIIQNVGVTPKGQLTWGLERLGVSKVWELGINGTGVRVAILDTGIQADHPDLKGKLFTIVEEDPFYPGGWIEFDREGKPVRTMPSDDLGHGTHVAGTIAGGNSSGVSIGIAPGAKLMVAKVVTKGFGTFAQILAGIQWAIDPFYFNETLGRWEKTGFPAHVVSISLGAYIYHDAFPPVADIVKALGITMVVAIGNGGPGTSGTPANVKSVIAVGAVNEDNNIAWFSSGERVTSWRLSSEEPYVKPDFVAPGVKILSSMPPSSYAELAGTSMATPHVSGTVALMIQASNKTGIDITPDEIYSILKGTSESTMFSSQNIREGWGLINAYRAVTLILNPTEIRGTVIDPEGNPVPDVLVTMINPDTSTIIATITSGNGVFEHPVISGGWLIGAMPAKRYAFNFTRIEVKSGEIAELNITVQEPPEFLLRGKVTDLSGNPIQGATVTLEPPAIADDFQALYLKLLGPKAVTGADGSFALRLTVGWWLANITVKAVADGYLASFLTIKDIFSIPSEVEFKLKQSSSIGVYFDWPPKILFGEEFGQSFLGEVTEFLIERGFKATDIPEMAIDDPRVISNFDTLLLLGPFPESTLSVAIEEGISIVVAGPALFSLERFLGQPEDVRWIFIFRIVGEQFNPITLTLDISSVNQPLTVLTGISFGETKMYLRSLNFISFLTYSRLEGFNLAKQSSRTIDVPESIAKELFGFESGFIVVNNSKIVIAASAFSYWPFTTVEYRWVHAKEMKSRLNAFSSLPLMKIEMDAIEGRVNQEVSVSISGAGPNSQVSVFFDSKEVAEGLADEEGSMKTSIVIPETYAGLHLVISIDESLGNVGISKFRIVPSLTVEPKKVSVGSFMKVVGKGFAANASITVTFPMPITLFTDENGSFEVNIPVLPIKPGRYLIEAFDAYGNKTSEEVVMFAEKEIGIALDVGELYLPGEVARIVVTTNLEGKPIDGLLTAYLMFPNGTRLELNLEKIDIGVYSATIMLDDNFPIGTYTVIVEASYETEFIIASGTSSAVFHVSGFSKVVEELISKATVAITVNIESATARMVNEVNILKADISSAISNVSEDVRRSTDDIKQAIRLARDEVSGFLEKLVEDVDQVANAIAGLTQDISLLSIYIQANIGLVSVALAILTMIALLIIRRKK